MENDDNADEIGTSKDDKFRDDDAKSAADLLETAKEMCRRSFAVPAVAVLTKRVNDVRKHPELKPLILTMRRQLNVLPCPRSVQCQSAGTSAADSDSNVNTEGVTDEDESRKLILFSRDSPLEMDNLSDETRHFLFQECGGILTTHTVPVTYANMNLQEVLGQILPDGVEVPSSFETVGHIAHLNLSDDQKQFGKIIGQVLLDKNPSLRTVVNKRSNLQNEFRNLDFELLAGESNYSATVSENGFVLDVDYDKVYWNSRLCAERERISNHVAPGALVLDVMAGVGGFGLYLASRQKCYVLANDLNPHAVRLIEHNARRNKLSDSITAFNLDGRKFIACAIRAAFERTRRQTGGGCTLMAAMQKTDSSHNVNSDNFRISDRQTDKITKCNSPSAASDERSAASASSTITRGPEGTEEELNLALHGRRDRRIDVLLNLPEIAIQFLDSFAGAACTPSSLTAESAASTPMVVSSTLPVSPVEGDFYTGNDPQIHVHCYCFSKSSAPRSDILERVTRHLGASPLEFGFRQIRDVAPRKVMYCAEFIVPPTLLLGPSYDGLRGNDTNDRKAGGTTLEERRCTDDATSDFSDRKRQGQNGKGIGNACGDRDAECSSLSYCEEDGKKRRCLPFSAKGRKEIL